MSDLYSQIGELWVEKYRPKSVNDLIYNEENENLFKKIVETGNIPNLILHGFDAGTGKTSTCKAICEDLGIDYWLINGSNSSKSILQDEGKLDAWMTTESQWSEYPYKVVIFDEIDGVSPQFKKAFKGFIEQYSSGDNDVARFFCTTNYIEDMTVHELSRMSVVSFEYPEADKKDIMEKMIRRLAFICKSENVKFDVKGLLEIVKTNMPDMRQCINQMYKVYMCSGEITFETVSKVTVFDDDTALVSILLNTEKESIGARYTTIRKMIKTNTSMINRVNRLINDKVVPELLNSEEILNDASKFIKVLKIVSDCGSVFSKHPQKDILICSTCVQLMSILNN